MDADHPVKEMEEAGAGNFGLAKRGGQAKTERGDERHVLFPLYYKRPIFCIRQRIIIFMQAECPKCDEWYGVYSVGSTG